MANNSFVKALFAGSIEQDFIFPYPKMDKEEEENLKLILDTVRQFAKDNIDPEEIDRNEEIPKEVLQGLAEIGLFGMSIP
ncbi:acyl-CoA dehydrogenase family protein, partial [candidate division KSB1 bacterium]|nr:acyl-CoA dehydrogenase family protein [candidate division KSB1 bacterium]